MGMPVNRPADAAGILVTRHIADITNTRQSVSIPTGAKWVSLSYRLLPGATATANQMLRVCLNAVSNDHANNMLSLDGMYVVVFQGEDLTLPADDVRINRLDLIAAAAVGTEKTMLRIVAGV